MKDNEILECLFLSTQIAYKAAESSKLLIEYFDQFGGVGLDPNFQNLRARIDENQASLQEIRNRFLLKIEQLKKHLPQDPLQ